MSKYFTVSAINGDVIADLLHAAFHAAVTLSGFIPGADLPVVQKVFSADICWGKIRHNYICSRKDPKFSPLRMNRSERGRRRKQNLWEQKAKNCQQMQRIPKCSRLLRVKRRVLMRDERADADHMRAQLLQKTKIFNQIFRGLDRCADHHSGADLITDLAQREQTVLSILQTQLSRMQGSIVVFIGSLMPQQITIRAGVIKRLIALAAALAQREGNGAIREFPANGTHERDHTIIGETRVLSSLQHKGAKAECVTLLTALKNLLLAQSIPFRFSVASANAAVIAVIPAKVRNLDQAAQKNGLSVGFVLNRSGSFIEIRLIFL